MPTNVMADITASEMRGDPVTIEVGGLSLLVKPLSRRDVRKFTALLPQWPEVLQFAAIVPNPRVYPLDYDATAMYLSLSAVAGWRAGEERRERVARDTNTPFVASPQPSDVTAEQVAEMVDGLVWGMDDATERVIRETVRLWTEPVKHFTDEELQDMLDTLEIPEYAMLLRLLVRSCGRFRGCLSDRMFRGSDNPQVGD
jgi:hypothetical protein